jgi:hypothetical protein
MCGIPAKKSRERLDNGLLIDVPGIRQMKGASMAKPMNIESLAALTSALIRGALMQIQGASRNLSSGHERRFQTVLYFLSESEEYVGGAWVMLASGKVRAALALSRWVLEAALDLLWTVADKDRADQRLRDLCGEALRQDAALAENLVKIWRDLAGPLNEKAKRARQMMEDLGAEGLQPLATRMDQLEASGEAGAELGALGPQLYALYRICCAAAHAGLKIWESSDNTILTPERACFVAAASPLYLVLSAHVLTDTGDAAELNNWWSDKVRPLLS